MKNIILLTICLFFSTVALAQVGHRSIGNQNEVMHAPLSSVSNAIPEAFNMAMPMATIAPLSQNTCSGSPIVPIADSSGQLQPGLLLNSLPTDQVYFYTEINQTGIYFDISNSSDAPIRVSGMTFVVATDNGTDTPIPVPFTIYKTTSSSSGQSLYTSPAEWSVVQSSSFTMPSSIPSATYVNISFHNSGFVLAPGASTGMYVYVNSPDFKLAFLQESESQDLVENDDITLTHRYTSNGLFQSAFAVGGFCGRIQYHKEDYSYWTRDNITNIRGSGSAAGAVASLVSTFPIAGTLVNTTNVAQTTTYTIFTYDVAGVQTTTTASVLVYPTNLNYYQDSDGDGYGNVAVSQFVTCEPPVGYVTNFRDCDDTNPNIHPGAVEIEGNSIDEDCSDCYTAVAGSVSASPEEICSLTQITLSAVDYSVGTGSLYQWQSSSSPSFADVTDVGAPTAMYSDATALASTDTYYRLKVSCTNEGLESFSAPVTVTFVAPSLVSVVDNARCGNGTVVLQAEADQDDEIFWYADTIGGPVVGSGPTFTTPSLESTTTYYAAPVKIKEGIISLGTNTLLTGNNNIPTAFSHATPFHEAQYLYQASELTASGLRAGNLNSIGFTIAALANPASNAQFRVRIKTTTATTIFSLQSTGFTTVFGPAIYTHSVGANMIPFNFPFYWDGVSNLLIEVYQAGTGSGTNAHTYYNTTPNSTVLDYGQGPVALNFRPDILFGGTGLTCLGERVPVVATVNAPPALTLSSNLESFCAGQSSDVLTLTSNVEDFDNYEWSPSIGVSGDAASGFTFNPQFSTIYTLTATQSDGSQCINTTTFEAVVQEIPLITNVTNSAPTVCDGGISQLSAITTSDGIFRLQGSAGTYTPISGTVASAPGDDSAQGNLPIGFPFTYAGTVHNVFSVASNGFIEMGSTASYSGSGQAGWVPYSNSFTARARVVAPFWDDNNMTGGNIQYQTSGEAPNRILTVQWTNMHAGGGGSSSSPVLTMQAKFYETSNVIQFVYGSSGENLNTTSASIGLTVALGEFVSVTPLATVNASTASSTIQNNAVTGNTLLSGTTFTFTPAIQNPITWTPITDLYLDAQATIPYTENTNAASVYAKPTIERNYTVTLTNAALCTATSEVTVALGEPVTYYADQDADTFGDPFNSFISCSGAPQGYVINNTDCNDFNFSVNPDAFEIYDNGIDDNCNGQTDSEEIPCPNTTTWNGTAWDFGVPNEDFLAIFAGNYNESVDIVACSIEVTNDATVAIPSGYNVTATGHVKVFSGSMTFENNANLMQIANVYNEGNITVKRDASMRRQDYVYWGSPVSNLTLAEFSPATLENRFYMFDEWSNSFYSITPDNGFNPSYGYMVRAPNNFPLDGSQATFHGEFTGVPNNGDYNFDAYNRNSQQGFNLMGNPYPSPVDADLFLAESPGTLYFWTHHVQGGGTGNNYASYNESGPVASASGVLPNGLIQVGQGFLFRTSQDTTARFTNNMRVLNNSGQFFRSSTSQKHRIWLNLYQQDTKMNQMLVGYISGATQDVDASFDGLLNYNGSSISSRIGDGNYGIQGRSLPFLPTDEVPLFFMAATAGNYTIELDHLDGLFAEDQAIYLKDNLTGIVHDIKNSSYQFVSEPGEFTERFSIVYQGMPLDVADLDIDSNSVVVLKNQNTIQIQSGIENIKEVRLFDIRGRLIHQKEDINALATVLQNIQSEQQVLLVQITLHNNQKVTKKIVF